MVKITDWQKNQWTDWRWGLTEENGWTKTICLRPLDKGLLNQIYRLWLLWMARFTYGEKKLSQLNADLLDNSNNAPQYFINHLTLCVENSLLPEILIAEIYIRPCKNIYTVLTLMHFSVLSNGSLDLWSPNWCSKVSRFQSSPFSLEKTNHSFKFMAN